MGDHPTPARAALGDLSDRTTPRLSTPTALGVILAGYLLFFGRAIVRAVQIDRTGEVLTPIDYGSYPGALEVTARLTQLVGAVLILMLVCRWLDIPRPCRHERAVGSGRKPWGQVGIRAETSPTPR